jgi:hypothetical protein
MSDTSVAAESHQSGKKDIRLNPSCVIKFRSRLSPSFILKAAVLSEVPKGENP